jgi:hypothetical protein
VAGSNPHTRFAARLHAFGYLAPQPVRSSA